MYFGKRDILFPEKMPGDEGSSTSSPALPRAQNLQLPARLIPRWQWPELLWSLPQGRLGVHPDQGEGRVAATWRGILNRPAGRMDSSPVIWLLFFSLRCSYLRLNFWIELELILFTRGRELREKMKNRLSVCRLQTELFDLEARRGVAWFYTPHQRIGIWRLLEVCHSVQGVRPFLSNFSVVFLNFIFKDPIVLIRDRQLDCVGPTLLV